jgi:thioesterase domain-containing protein
VSVQNTTSLDLALPGVESIYEDVPTDTANFDLALILEEQGTSYRGWVEARSAVWSPAALDRFLAGFLSSLETLVHAPERPLGGPRSAAVADLHPPPGVGAESVGRARNELERRIIAIWEDVMGLRPLAPESHFFALGGHSLLAARIFDRIGQTIGREVPLAALLQAPTIRQLTELILHEGDVPCWATLVPVQSRGARPPLFCVHGGGGGVLSYTRIAAYLGEDRPLWGLQAPKREGDSASPQVEEMAAEYLRAILSIQPEGPYHLCGHSFGGLVAFEIARQLSEQGRLPDLLVVIDYPGPDARVTWLEKLRWFTYSLAQLDRRQRVPYVVDRLRYRIRTNPRLYRALTRAGGLLGLPVDPHKTEYRLKTMSATMTAMELYRPSSYPGRLTLFRAHGGDAAINADPLGGWGRTALGGVEVRDFSCDHMEIFEEPHVRDVALALRDSLARAEQDSSGMITPEGPAEAETLVSN